MGIIELVFRGMIVLMLFGSLAVWLGVGMFFMEWWDSRR